MIMAHLIYDSPTLRSCSLTCYSWYTAAVPHLHPTLNIFFYRWGQKSYRWPDPIRRMHVLGLLPFVKSVTICCGIFSPKMFNPRISRQFSALTNVKRLEIDDLDIPSFVPKVRRYFGSFLPTLRSLRLKSPKGSNRHIIFFIGLFQHLENLELSSPRFWYGEENQTLIPSLTPPLQGRLVARDLERTNFFQDMAHLFGGIRFSALDIFGVKDTKFLLRACAKTLRMLQLHPTDSRGE